MKSFQIVLLAIFGFFIVASVIVFSVYKGGGSSSYKVTIWGSLPASGINKLLEDANFKTDKTISMHYEEKSEANLEKAFTEALAQGNGPDLIILTQDKLWETKKKLVPIPYVSISQHDFESTFFDGSSIFLGSEGVYALPLVVDPLVLYYNRDLLSSAGIASPISYWDEIYSHATALTTKDNAGNITQTVMALGETRNISHFKDIFSLLLIQAGTPITNPENYPKVLLTESFGQPVLPAVSALDFYTQFANPAKPFYSWNRNLPEALSFFSSGDAAYYMGYASELPLVKSKSPTLNFAITSVPQSRVSGRKTTYGRIYSVALSRGSENPNAALSVALKLISSQAEKAISTSLGLAPARRDLLSVRQTDAMGPVLFESALKTHSWIDPNASASRDLLSDMIESVTSGRSRAGDAVLKANERLEALFNTQ